MPKPLTKIEIENLLFLDSIIDGFIELGEFELGQTARDRRDKEIAKLISNQLKEGSIHARKL